MKLSLAILLLALSVGAQTANVIELAPADQARAQKAWDALQKAQAEWQSIKDETESHYVPNGEKGHCTSNSHNRCVADEWYGGFEFSRDFRAIVPSRAASITTTGTIWGGCPTWTYPSTPCIGTGCTIIPNGGITYQ